VKEAMKAKELQVKVSQVMDAKESQVMEVKEKEFRVKVSQ